MEPPEAWELEGKAWELGARAWELWGEGVRVHLQRLAGTVLTDRHGPCRLLLGSGCGEPPPSLLQAGRAYGGGEPRGPGAHR